MYNGEQIYIYIYIYNVGIGKVRNIIIVKYGGLWGYLSALSLGW